MKCFQPNQFSVNRNALVTAMFREIACATSAKMFVGIIPYPRPYENAKDRYIALAESIQRNRANKNMKASFLLNCNRYFTAGSPRRQQFAPHFNTPPEIVLYEYLMNKSHSSRISKSHYGTATYTYKRTPLSDFLFWTKSKWRALFCFRNSIDHCYVNADLLYIRKAVYGNDFL